MSQSANIRVPIAGFNDTDYGILFRFQDASDPRLVRKKPTKNAMHANNRNKALEMHQTKFLIRYAK